MADLNRGLTAPLEAMTKRRNYSRRDVFENRHARIGGFSLGQVSPIWRGRSPLDGRLKPALQRKDA